MSSLARVWVRCGMDKHAIKAVAHLHELVCHADMLCIDAHVFRGRHCHERHRALVAKVLVGPGPDAADELDCGNAVVGDQHAASQSHTQRLLPTLLWDTPAPQSILITDLLPCNQLQ